jgi:trafficking protein particle complex subunit 1
MRVLSMQSVTGADECLNYMRTSGYTLHHFETASGLRFVLNSDNSIGDLRASLRHIYSGIWVRPTVASC